MPQILVTPTKEKPTGYEMPETLEEKTLAVFKPTQPFELVGTGQVFEQDFVGYEVDRRGVIRNFYPTGFTPTTSLFDALGYGLGIIPFGLGLIAGYFSPLPPEEKMGEREKEVLQHQPREVPSTYSLGITGSHNTVNIQREADVNLRDFYEWLKEEERKEKITPSGDYHSRSEETIDIKNAKVDVIIKGGDFTYNRKTETRCD